MSTPTEKLEAQKMAFLHQPVQPWHRHLVGPAEFEQLLTANSERITGQCVDAGDDESGNVRVIIITTREQLAALKVNPIYSEVTVIFEG